VDAETVYLEGSQAGQVAAHGVADYDETKHQISILKPMSQWYPVQRQRYRLTVTVDDRAGNRSTTSLEHRYGSTCGDVPEPVAAHRPGSTAQFLGQAVFAGFEPWANGDVLYENPVTLVWRLPRHNWYNENPYGIEFTPVYQDETYVYMTVKKPLLPAPNSNDGNWSTRTTWGCKAYNDFQGTLAEGVGATPKLVSGDIALAGQWIGGRSTWNQKIHVPTTVTRLRAEVEARPYVQIVKVLSTLGTLTCQAPVGATRCEIELAWQPPPERDYYAWQIRLDNEAGEFYAYADYYYFYWDYVAPLIDTMTLDEGRQQVSIAVTDPHTTSDWRNPWWQPQTVQLLATRPDGNTQTLKPIANRNPTTNAYFYDFNLGQLDEGQYTLTARVVDTFNNERTRQWGDYGVDHTGPTVTLTVAPDDRPLQGEVEVEVLEDIRIHLRDAVDADPVITDITLSGGPQHDTVHLAWRQEGDNWYLEYPVMFPSLETGDYQLRVTARDASGNRSEKTASFSYQPHRINLIGGNTLTLPVSDRPFSRRNGLPALATEMVAMRDGTLLEGRYDIYGTMSTDGIAVVVNGVRLEPGQTVKVADGYLLGNGNEHLRLSLAAPQPGTGQLLLTMPGAPRSPVIQAQLTVWQAAVELTAPRWTVQQVLDPLDISAGAATGVPCEVTSDLARARDADVFSSPVCYLEWTALPDEGVTVAGTPPKITGQAVALGEQRIAYTLSLFDNGSPVMVGGGEQRLTVVAPTLPFQPDKPIDKVYRAVQELSFGLLAEGGRCDPYVDETAARTRGTANRPTCLLTWQALPPGLKQDPMAIRPLLEGYLDSAGPHTLGWQASLFSQRGTRVTLTPQQYTLTTVEPPAPTIDIIGEQPLDKTLLAVPQAGGKLGAVQVKAPTGGLTLTVAVPGQEPKQERYEPTGSSAESRMARMIEVPAGTLWSKKPITLTAAYTRLPDVQTRQTIDALYVPSTSIQATLEAPREMLDTQQLPLVLAVGVPQPDGALSCDSRSMGEWQGFVGYKDKKKGLIPLTDNLPLANGRQSFQVDIAGRDSLVLYGVVTLNSPDHRYQKTETTLPVYVTLLKGTPITGNIVTRRALTGPAPYKAALSLALDRPSQQALGEVHWQVSRDSGATWQALSERVNQISINTTFDVGRYQVRARLLNKNTGAEGFSETVAIHVYDVPKLAVVGTRTGFTGAPIQLTAQLRVRDQPVAGVVEWWLAKEKQKVADGLTYTFAKDKPTAVPLEVRAWLESAPADDPAAWVTARYTVDIKEPAPPGVQISGPTYIEVGAAYRFTAAMQLPSPWMLPAEYPLRGEWQLPDGRTVAGMSVDYTPTAAAADAGRVELVFTGWIEGYRDTGGSRQVTQRVTVGRYLWPAFELSVRQRIAYAPSQVTLEVIAPGFTGRLEKPVYTWSMPPNARVLQQQDRQATLELATAGTYPVQVEITDSRGNRSQVQTTLTALEPIPYELTLDARPSNTHHRAPLDVTLYVDATGGHPSDRPRQYRFYQNERLATEGTGNYARFIGLPVGEHTLRAEIESTYGARASKALPMTVVANQPPVCTLDAEPRSGGKYYRLTAACKNPDGQMVGYRWVVNGTPVGLSGATLSVTPVAGQALVVELTAVDDADGLTTVTRTLP